MADDTSPFNGVSGRIDTKTFANSQPARLRLSLHFVLSTPAIYVKAYLCNVSISTRRRLPEDYRNLKNVGRMATEGCSPQHGLRIVVYRASHTDTLPGPLNQATCSIFTRFEIHQQIREIYTGALSLLSARSLAPQPGKRFTGKNCPLHCRRYRNVPLISSFAAVVKVIYQIQI